MFIGQRQFSPPAGKTDFSPPNRSRSPSHHSSYVVHWRPTSPSGVPATPSSNPGRSSVLRRISVSPLTIPLSGRIGIYDPQYPEHPPPDALGDLVPITPPPGSSSSNVLAPHLVHLLKTHPQYVVDAAGLEHFAHVKHMLRHLVTYDSPITSAIRNCLEGGACPHFPGFRHFNPNYNNKTSAGLNTVSTRGRRATRGRGRGGTKRGRGALSGQRLFPEPGINGTARRSRGITRRGRGRGSSVIVAGPNIATNYYNTRSSVGNRSLFTGEIINVSSVSNLPVNSTRGPIPAAAGAPSPSSKNVGSTGGESSGSNNNNNRGSNIPNGSRVNPEEVITFWSASDDSGESSSSTTLFSSAGETNCPNAPVKTMANKAASIKKEVVDCGPSTQVSFHSPYICYLIGLYSLDICAHLHGYGGNLKKIG